MKTKKLKKVVIVVSRTYPSYHRKKGQQTNFIEKISCGSQCPGDCKICDFKEGKKIHTFRGNYLWWKKQIDEVLAGNAVIVLKYHSLGRYVKGNKQIEFARFDNYSGIGIQEAIYKSEYEEPFEGMAIRCEDGIFRDFPFSRVSENDGLSEADFACWFEKGDYDLTASMACIHFTNFRYGRP